MFECCKDMQRSILHHEFKLYTQYRGVCYYIYREEDGSYGQHFFRYCPYCGAKLPKHFFASDEYENALEEAVGKEFCDITEEEIPEEFKTDEWWKKRGLQVLLSECGSNIILIWDVAVVYCHFPY